jgi:hypothetical protein
MNGVTLDGMSFFESIPQPPPEPVPSQTPAWMRPDEVIPGAVPGEMLIARTRQAAVALGSVRAYPNGFEFTLHVRTRDKAEFGLGADPFEWRRRQLGQQDKEDHLRLGILYADGRRAAATNRSWPDDVDDEQLILIPDGSSADDHRWDGDFWAHPLPPEGPVTFVVSWPRYGVAETRAEFDGAAIRAGAQRAVSLWPEEPEL